MNELKRHKKSDKIKWVITSIAFVLVFVFLAGLCMQLFGNDKLKPLNWFKKTECVHIDENTDGKCDECGKDIPIDNGEIVTGADSSGLLVTPPGNANKAVCLSVARLSDIMDESEIQSYAEDNGISTQAASTVQRITATVSPADASYQVIDWSVAWKNPSSTWASGKTVTNYVTVTPTSDGALTADVTCKQAFGEKIEIKASLRGSSALVSNACVVDYVRKVVGASPRLYNGLSSSSLYYFNWNLSVTNLNPTVDFYRGAANFQDFILSQESGSDGYGRLTDNYVYSDTYTIDMGLNGEQSFVLGTKYYIQPTSDYLSYMRSAGFNVKSDAGNYWEFVTAYNGRFSLYDILCGHYSDTQTDSVLASFKRTLNSNASKVMFHLKVVTPALDNIPLTETIYNIKFSTSSLTATAQSVSLSDSNIRF